MNPLRPAVALLSALLTLLTGALVTVPAASASPVPLALEAITFPAGPYARLGWVNVPVAQVQLEVAASGDTVISVASSDPDVAAVPASVTVPAGQSSAAIPVTALSQGQTTLSVSLGAQTLSATPDLRVGGPSETGTLDAVSVQRSSMQPGDSTTGTVMLDFLAGPGGSTVELSSSDPTVTVPDSVVVPADHGLVTFPVLSQSSTSGTAVITATAGQVTRTVELSVADTLAPDTMITGGWRPRLHRFAVEFAATEAGSTFRCRVDQRPYKPCTSPHVFRKLAFGRHVVRVRATDLAGNVDRTPARQEYHLWR